MLFFKRIARPCRSSAAIKARLRVEQLESRWVPCAFLPGNEFLVNTDTSHSHQTSSSGANSVATDSAGDFVVVWSSNGQDGNGWGVYGQRYAANGTTRGSEFRVNTYTQGDQKDANVAMDSAGDFAVVWSSYGQDGSGWGVYAQRYNACGRAQGSEFRVNTYTQGDQEYSTVAMNSTGTFVIAWSSYGQDGSGWGIYAQRYNACGQAQGSEFQVNTYTQGDQMYSSVAMDGSGNFTITWQSNGQDGSGWGIYMQQYTATGARSGSETRVNSTTAGDQMYPSLAMTSTGQAIFVWCGNGVGDSSGVFAKQAQLI